MRAVVLVSGGMDSLVTAAKARRSGRDLVFLHVIYGQRTAAREQRAFDDIADFYRPRRRLVADIAYLRTIGGSALTDPAAPVPQEGALSPGGASAAADAAGIPATYVPFRNAHLLSIAASLAEVEAAGEIWIGASEVDYSGYPDCRRIFFDAFERVIDAGTRPDTSISVVTPLMDMSKGRIVREGLRLGAPFELSWSCYVESEEACGRCESCRLRLAGFADAKVRDPIAYSQRAGS